MTRSHSAAARPQGIHLQAVRGQLEANGTRAQDLVIWADSSPDIATVTCVPQKGQVASVRLWNVWRDENEFEHAWVGNCGIIVTTVDGIFDVECSDGWGEPNFGDLRFRIDAPGWVLDQV
jgi:hypothetical protein